MDFFCGLPTFVPYEKETAFTKFIFGDDGIVLNTFSIAAYLWAFSYPIFTNRMPPQAQC